jgi:hypothetical protein
MFGAQAIAGFSALQLIFLFFLQENELQRHLSRSSGLD